MLAFIVNQPGGPDVLKPVALADPKPIVGQVLIQVKAFGLNRAELVTRMGGSGDAVKFPKVIGIECVGEVLDCPDGRLQPGQKVAAAMGGMGRKYNGSYAEKVVMPLSNVFPIETSLSWTELAAIPETYFTAWGCLFQSLQIRPKARVLVRPGASALGVAVTQIVNHLGGEVIGVTRSAAKKEALLAAGMKAVIVSSAAVNDEVRTYWPNGADGIIDTIVSSVSVSDDLKIRHNKGRICVAGSLAESYGQDTSGFIAQVVSELPYVGFYSSETISAEKETQVLQTVINRIEAGDYQNPIAATFPFESLPQAHMDMERNAFAGKVVITF